MAKIVEILNKKIEFNFEADWIIDEIDSTLVLANIMGYDILTLFEPESEFCYFKKEDKCVLKTDPYIRYFFNKNKKSVKIVFFFNGKLKFKELAVNFSGEKTKTGKIKKNLILSHLCEEEEIKNTFNMIKKFL